MRTIRHGTAISSENSESTKRCPGVTARVAVLCLALAALFGFLIPLIDFKLNNTFLGATHLPPGAIAALLVLLFAVNPMLRFVSKRLAFTRNESLTVYITCLFSCLVPGHGSETLIIPSLISPFYYASPINKWLDFLQPGLKPWLTPALNADGSVNTAVVAGFQQGASGVVPWSAWLVPLVFWGSFALVSYAMLGCLSVMLRAQWAEREALTFPLLKLPLQLTEGMAQNRGDDAPALPLFFRNGLMWMGFGIAAFIQLVNGLNVYFPDVPPINLSVNTAPMFSEPPWNQIGWVNLTTFPIAVGIAYLLTTEVSFSLWFFFWFMKFQLIAAYLLGYPPSTLPSAPGGFTDKLFAGFQQLGAYLAYVAMILWLAREHLGHIASRAFGRARARTGEAEEVISYPLAFWGFVGSFVLMTLATCLAGVRLDIALALWVSYLVFAIGLSRVAVEGGVLFLLHNNVMPLGAITRLLGSGPSTWLVPENGVVPASLFQTGFAYHMRGFLMPSFIQSFKLAYDEKINGRRLAWLLVGVILVSLVVGWLQLLRLSYGTGAMAMGNKWYMTLGSQSPANFITAMSKGDIPVGQSWFWLGVGAALTYGMMLARTRLMWFPFHPIGYIMALTYPGQMFWFSIFLGWSAKTLLNRFGGADTVRKTTPFFLGMVLGDVSMMLFWLLIDGWQGRTSHQLMPG
ncbi:MAG TPA: DUF6785 family protein [Abditibacteriaceae bacterium]